MSFSIALLIATVITGFYGLFSGNMELFSFTVVVIFLKYKEESKRN